MKNGQRDAVFRLIRLSPTVRYAIEGLVRLARSPRPFLDTREVARAGGLPESFLSKIFQTLGQAGLLEAQRGPGGGYALARPAERISLAEIVAACEPQAGRPARCVMGNRPCGERPCQLHRAMSSADKTVALALRKLSLARLACEMKEGRI